MSHNWERKKGKAGQGQGNFLLKSMHRSMLIGLDRSSIMWLLRKALLVRLGAERELVIEYGRNNHGNTFREIHQENVPRTEETG